jgi:hypothetical protein
MVKKLATEIGPLDWRTAIVDKQGRPTQEFQIRWNTQRGDNNLIGSISTGSGAPTGTPTDGQMYLDISSTPWTLYSGHNKAWHTVGVVNFTDLADVPHSYTGNNNNLVQVNSSGTGLAFHGLTLRLYGGFSGRPNAGQTLFEITMCGDEQFPTNLSGSKLGFDVSNTNACTLPITVNGTNVGHASITAGGGSVSYVLTTGYTATAGDKLAFIAPTPQDPTLSGLTYTWLGTRTNV